MEKNIPAFCTFWFVAFGWVSSASSARRDARLNVPFGLLLLPRDFVAVEDILSTLTLDIFLEKRLKFPVDGNHMHEISFVADALLRKACITCVEYLTAHLILRFAIFISVVIARRKKFKELMRVVVTDGIVKARFLELNVIKRFINRLRHDNFGFP